VKFYQTTLGHIPEELYTLVCGKLAHKNLARIVSTFGQALNEIEYRLNIDRVLFVEQKTGY
jgi:hypothetical protein